MDLSEHDSKAVKESLKELHNKEREREAKIIEIIANLESKLTKLDEQTDLNFIQVEETEAMIVNELSSLESENKELLERVECLEIMNKWQTGLLSFLAGRITKDSIEYHKLMSVIAIEVAIGNTDALVDETIEEIKNQKIKTTK